MPKKYRIETFGCQMNVHDSERMAGLLDRAGYEPATSDRDADVIVINTCSVREHAEAKLYTRLGQIRVLGQETGKAPVVAVAGCVAQQEGHSLLARTNGRVIDVVVGTQQVKMLPMLLDRAAHSAHSEVNTDSRDDVGFPLGVARRSDPVKAYVTIIEGCNDHCAFCVVPHTRGHERMRSKSDILAEVQEAADSGAREVQLLGQIVNHYQAPDDHLCDFAELLKRVNAICGIERIRFASPHPRHTGIRLIEAIRDLPKVCKHIHLPLQSGSSRVLRTMRRRHTAEEYLKLVNRIREAIPNVTLSTDIIIGFPGETSEDFNQTLSLVEEVRYHSVFSFKYSVRPNTLASQRLPDDISADEKTARIVALQSLQRKIQLELHGQLVGTTLGVLVDQASKRHDGEVAGRTTGNTIVNFPIPQGGKPEDWIGRTVRVTIKRAGPNSLRGEAMGTEVR